MKTKLILIAALVSLTFMVGAKSDDTEKEAEKIKVTIDTDGGKMVKKIIVNGKELNAEEIKEFEASGKMKKLHIDHEGLAGKKGYKVIVIDDKDGAHDGKHGDMEKHVKIIKKHMKNGDGKVHKNKWITKGDGETIEVTIDADGDKTTEKIVVNGKELSAEEIKEFKASGKMKVIHLNKDMKGMDGHKMMFINSDSEDGDVDIDIEVIMEKLGKLHENHDGQSLVKEWHSDDGKSVHIIEKKILLKNNDSASLGVMANISDDGWHLTKVIEKSGAEQAGINVGDTVKSIAGVDLTKSSDPQMHEVKELPKFKKGEIVKVVVERDGKTLNFDVEARELNTSNLLMEITTDVNENFKWVEKLKAGDNSFTQDIKVMVFNGDEDDFRLNEDDIHMVFPESLGDMNIFISDGHSTSKLLGKHHEMSSLSDDLGKYFHTKGGVLVLHVDDSNAFSLKDGDVIKSINGHSVDSPKDVVKQLIEAEEQEKIKLKVIRHKKSKTLKYHK